MIKNAPENFVIKAMKINEIDIIQKEEDEKFMSLKFIDKPTITKKIGVNIWIIGVILFFTSLRSISLVLKNAPNGKKNLLERAYNLLQKSLR